MEINELVKALNLRGGSKVAGLRRDAVLLR